MTKKILLIGRASTGKTSIKKAIFEGSDPNFLMVKPLSPTRGIETNNYEWLDLNLSIFDSSGQEINDLFNNEEQQNKAFNKTDAVIYIFDYPLWVIKPKEIVEEVHRIYTLLKNHYEKAKLVIVLHKVDLINIKLRTRLSHLKKKIIETINLPHDFDFYFTSIYPKIIFNTFNAFFNICSRLSERSLHLKSILDNFMIYLSKAICFITNKKNRVLVQTMTNDFNINDIHSLHKIIADIDHSKEELEVVYDKLHLFGIGETLYTLYITNIDLPELKNLICVSELTGPDLVKQTIKNMKSELISFDLNR